MAMLWCFTGRTLSFAMRRWSRHLLPNMLVERKGLVQVYLQHVMQTWHKPGPYMQDLLIQYLAIMYKQLWVYDV